MTATAARAAATREAFGPTLIRLAEAGYDIVTLEADLSASTGGRQLKAAFPERWYTVGASEANMISMAAGLAADGKTVFAASFAVFVPGHCFDQVRMSVAQPGLNVKLVASHGGVSVGEDGASAQAIEDLSLVTALPGMTVVVPADVVEAAQAIWAAGTTAGPFYIRLGRPKVPMVYGDEYRFALGRAHRLREGGDATVIACGHLVAAAREAAERLAAGGVSVRVLNMATITPLDEEAVISAARETGAIVTAEEHLVQGGLGAAVTRARAATYPAPVEQVGVRDRYGESGRWDQLLERFGLDAGGVEAAVQRVLQRKN